MTHVARSRAETTQAPGQIMVTIRYFAAARAAAGTESEKVGIPADTTIAEVIENLSRRDPKIASILRRCSFLCDGIAVRDPSAALSDGHTIDVLPPFAGG
ncbi:MAG: MoaD/ThiS family protein [Mycobacteriaceae bacterium]|nr:MoaD/ThiS family protein [Mycobacteriaceae bacterium]